MIFMPLLEGDIVDDMVKLGVPKPVAISLLPLALLFGLAFVLILYFSRSKDI